MYGFLSCFHSSICPPESTKRETVHQHLAHPRDEHPRVLHHPSCSACSLFRFPEHEAIYIELFDV